MANEPRYSIVVPMFNEQEVIEETCRRLVGVMEEVGEPFEIVLVNDGSRDRTNEIAEAICDRDERIKLIRFSRNFGHQIAVTAGVDYAAGQAVVLIDADLQDPPELIPDMIAKWREGYDVVYGKRIKRKGETWFKKATASLFYRMLRHMTSVEIPTDTGDFRLMDRKVCDVLRGLREKNRFVRGLVSWVGFRQTSVEYVREERFAGETKYPLRKMLRFALDGITSFSHKPLRFAAYVGFALSIGSFAYLVVVVYQRLFTDSTEPGWASLIAINLFFHGMLFMMLGVMGEYIGRIYEESKNRPLYVVRQTRNLDEQGESGREPR